MRNTLKHLVEGMELRNNFPTKGVLEAVHHRDLSEEHRHHFERHEGRDGHGQ
jgi:hypothetical protein